MFPEQIMVGGSTSLTVIVNEHSADPTQESVAVQVTMVSPTGNRVPEAGLQLATTSGQLVLTVGDE